MKPKISRNINKIFKFELAKIPCFKKSKNKT